MLAKHVLLDRCRMNLTLHSLVCWWKKDPSEFHKQTEEYETLRFYQSARGVAALLMTVFALLVFILTTVVMHQVTVAHTVQISLSLILIAFVYRGYKWALTIAMFLGTISSITHLYNSIVRDPTDMLSIFFIYLLWSLYMRACYLALLVEKNRGIKNAGSD